MAHENRRFVRRSRLKWVGRRAFSLVLATKSRLISSRRSARSYGKDARTHFQVAFSLRREEKPNCSKTSYQLNQSNEKPGHVALRILIKKSKIRRKSLRGFVCLRAAEEGEGVLALRLFLSTEREGYFGFALSSSSIVLNSSNSRRGSRSVSAAV